MTAHAAADSDELRAVLGRLSDGPSLIAVRTSREVVDPLLFSALRP
jgi:hypothetical protein